MNDQKRHQTLYVGEADLAVWREARGYCLANQLPLSAFITRAVRLHLEAIRLRQAAFPSGVMKVMKRRTSK